MIVLNMMNSDDMLLLDFLRTVGKLHAALESILVKLKVDARVRSVTRWTSIPLLKDGARIEEYLDAELSNGKACSWSVHITLSASGWSTEADVRIAHKSGQDLVDEFESRECMSLSECLDEIARVDEYITSKERVFEELLG